MGRGIEVHSGHIVIPASEIRKLSMGTVASPLAQIEAGQIVVSAVINAVALGGNVKAGLYGVNISVNMTGSPIGLHTFANVLAGITLTGVLTGHLIQSDVLDGSVVTGEWNALRIEMYTHTGATVSLPAYAIFITNFLQSMPADYVFIRGSENGGGTMNSMMHWFLGAGSDADYYMQLSPQARTAWSYTGNPSVQQGWLKIQVGSFDRWIALQSVAP